ncbi:XRE family transcriptional regulator [Rhizobium sp. Root73]|uniref:helix-turn-helix domain-containing protein n=1 Tax=unclassified Rhizobium TaxID=2613769 RepID=UPI00071277A3|nr:MULTISPECIES: helix-turn-helix transcriptional regulator [unclassified Rhizobium]KQV29204.1 XRE family transcriptional regulator [Rhizobium sp. Root1204]KQY03720.1 XRE family transcriptional regulator [Rhizobium sp. Root1334]KRC00358.1 XRE family transcriptional regulator [Rhizobium sp. Root73]
MIEKPSSAGDLLRDWRQRRRLSQLALAADADISQRHLSFLESGRALPSRDMVLRLTETLAVPLREQNAILVAAGFAPLYRDRPLDAPELAAARGVITRILDGHDPHPALAVDRHWTLLASNRAVGVLLSGVAEHLLSGPVNVLRVSMHPDGIAGRILNFREWRTHILKRLSHDIDISADPQLAALLEELKSYPVPPQAGAARKPQRSGHAEIAVPLILAGERGPLSFLSTTTVFGTAVDVTLSEVTIEAFFPADAATAKAMAMLVGHGGSEPSS